MRCLTGDENDPVSLSKTLENRGFLRHRVKSADYRHLPKVGSTALARIGRWCTLGVMVRAMAFDCGALTRVACITALFACGPTVKPGSVPGEPGPVTRGAPPLKIDPSGRHVMVGEMCPQGAAGRPAVTPLIMRGVEWTDNNADVTATVERGTVARFVVFGVDGKPAGAFDTLGLVDIAPGQSVASGTYVGASPCTYSVSANPNAGQMQTRGEDPACGLATKGCGIAVGEIAHPDDVPPSPVFATSGACMSGDDLAVDIDGDGVLETFPIANALDGIRAPASEWSASATATPSAPGPCKPTFAVYGLKLMAPARSAKAIPVKGVPVAPAAGDAMVTLDVLGVIDLDGDGRKELILAMRFPTVRSIVVYTATESSQRLELAGEGQSFAR